MATAKQTVKKVIDRGLRRFGWRLTRTTTPPSVLDLRGETDDPVAAIYLARQHPFVIDVPLARCRGLGLLAFDLGPKTAHPWVRTLQAYSRGHCTEFESSPLERYYDHFQPDTAAAILGLEDNSRFADLHPFAVVAPWHHPSRLQERQQAIVEREDRGRRGAPVPWNPFGPISHESGALEMSRLTGVHRSIQQVGFCRHEGANGDIECILFVGDKGWAGVVREGHHRIAALAALGELRAPVRFMDPGGDLIVRREDVDRWPHVRSGLYTSRQALAVFDRILEGRPPHGAVPPEWEDVVETG